MSVETKFISRELNDLLWREGFSLSTAESCTAGNVAASITAIPGSSQFYKGGVVGYSVEVKEQMLGVSHETIEKYGAVSEETVIEMAKGAMKTLKTDYSVATTGIAGPGGGTSEIPVGTIWIAAANADRIVTKKLEGDEGRERNVLNAVCEVLHLLLDFLKENCKDNENQNKNDIQ